MKYTIEYQNDAIADLEKLTQAVPLITLTGISGMGKSKLAVQLVRQITDEFESVIWCSLQTSTTLAEFEDRLIQFFSQSQQPDIPGTKPQTLPPIKYLQKHRSLVVLDEIHNLFSSGELVGKYQAIHQEYRSFFKQIENLSHQSCFLLIGWEQPGEIPQVNSNNTPIRSLQLAGLDIAAGRQILRNCGFAETDYWETLINNYQGNPLWLKSVAAQIQELEGNLTELLPKNTILLPEDLKDILQHQCDRLSETEKQIMSLLATKNEPISLGKLLEIAQIPSSDLVNAIQSLCRRSLIKREENLYSLPVVLRQQVGIF